MFKNLVSVACQEFRRAFSIILHYFHVKPPFRTLPKKISKKKKSTLFLPEVGVTKKIVINLVPVHFQADLAEISQ